MANGSSPNVSNLNIGKDIPSFISDKNGSKKSNDTSDGEEKEVKKKRSFFSRKKKK